MDDSTNRGAAQWSMSPSAKAKNAVQRSVTALLDELAPERVLRRIEVVPDAVEQHRTPNGCVLQAADCALSVSWFADATKASPYGELHVLVWRGKVARRGSARNAKGATLLEQQVFHPIEPPSDECIWEAEGGRYDTAALAARCLGLLDRQIGAERK